MLGTLRGLLSLGCAGAICRSELVILDIDDIREEDNGLCVTIRRRKTVLFGVEFEKGILADAHLETYPVCAYQAVIEAPHFSSRAILELSIAMAISQIGVPMSVPWPGRSRTLRASPG